MMQALRLAVALMACTASGVLMGCSGNTDDNHHETLPCVGKTSNDIFCVWTDGTAMPEADKEVAQLGLQTVYRPYESLRVMGVTGVAPLGNLCVVALNRNGVTSINRLSLTIAERGPRDAEQLPVRVSANVTPTQAKAMIEAATPQCSGSSSAPA